MEETPENKDAAQHHPVLTIVGIGASAGGLAALKTFFSLVPEDSGLAYVVVVHLSPEHKSALAELLQVHVHMPVEQVTETVALKPNHVYVIPPKANLSAVDTHLHLSELEENRKDRAPIDHFFRTLAKTHDGRSIGVILTGTGSDGASGIKEIKMKNGLTIVQDPHDAEFDGMPQSAIATGVVDVVLPLKDIPAYLLKYNATHPRLKSLELGQEPDAEERQLIQKIYAQVRARTGRDFSRYKLSTIMRRLQRRMQLQQIENLKDYLDLLRNNLEEVHSLSDDFLINVTSFFRDSEVYKELEGKLIPRLFENKNPDGQIRVWSVGCATGEEAYSLGMLLLEEASRRQMAPSLHVFASDLHEHSLAKARDGFYPGDIEIDVGEARLRRFFVKEDGGYRVRKELRELVIFTPHNLLGDPPFSRIDLLLCRNLLIYLKREVQRDVFELFHYALQPNGFLVLGTSEHLENSDLYRIESKELSIYTKRNVAGPEPRLPVFLRLQARIPEELPPEKEPNSLPYGVIHQHMVEHYAPPSILLSANHQVMHVSETAGRYLMISGGELSRDIFRLIRPEIQMELRSTIFAARKKKKLIRSKPLQVTIEGEQYLLIVSVRVIDEPSQEHVILVMFEEYDDPATAERHSYEGPVAVSDAARMKEIEQELQENQQRMQTILEEYETSREEMKASNEELQSANEELRSTLEELETSKEELQSVNEELITVNQENRHKVEELAQMSDDLQNLLASTDIATLFLDKKLHILRFTPKLSELFNVRLADRGRPISDQTHKLGYDALEKDARQVLRNLIPIEREVQDRKGNTYLTRILPYRSSEDRIDGVVITFVDITSRKQVEEELKKAKIYAESIIETLHEPLLVLTPDLRVKSVNQAFYTHFEVNPKETEGRLVYHLGNNQWDIPELRTLLEDVLPENNVFNDFEVEHEFEQIGRRVMLLNARRLDHVQLILLGIRDITEWKEAQEALQKSDERKAFLLKLLHAIHMLSDPSEIHEAVTRSAIDHFKADRCYYCEIEGEVAIIRKDASRQDLPSVVAEYPLSSMPIFKAVVDAGKPFVVEDVHTTDLVDENLRQLCIRLQVISFVDVPLIKNGKPVGILCITQCSPRKWTELEVELAEETAERTWAAIERIKVEEALRKSEERMRITIEAAELATWEWNVETNEVLWNEQHYLLFGLKPEKKLQTVDSFFSYVHQDDLERVGTELKKSIEEKTVFDSEFRAVLEDGSIRWMSGYGRITEESNGKPLKVSGVMSDTTASKSAHESLRQSEERFRLSTRAGDAFSWELEMPAQTFSYAGDAVEILGVPSESALPQTLEEMMGLVHEDDRERILEEFAQAKEEADTYTLSFRVKKSEEETIWIEKHGKVFRNEQGEAVRIIGIAQNITKRKETEQELRKAKEQAEHAARAKDEFLSTMSHEIRTPLNAIIGLSNLLLKKNPRPEQLENLSTLKFSSHSLLNLINDILDYSKLEAGKVEMENVDYSLSTLIHSIWQSHCPLAEEKGNELRFQVAEHVPDVLRSDPHKLAQILNNLISNANKFTEKGTISVEVNLEKQEGNEVWLHFAVRDTGTGISEEKLQTIFEKFTQGDSSTVRRYGGTGLGLSITKSLLQLMESDIQVESKEGEGSAFYFTIRQQMGSEANLSPEEEASPSPQGEKHQVKSGIRILLVDDAAFNRMVLQQHLQEWWALQADEATHGLEAVEKARQKKYDLILMDIRMPEMDGLEASRRIRALDEHYARVPIIVLTADTSLTRVKEGETGIFSGILTKPFEPEQLMNTISAYVLVQQESQRAESRKADAPENEVQVGISSEAPELNFARVEQSFQSSEKRKRNFYATALTSLQTYQRDYLQALEEGDARQLEEVMHKAKMLFNMLGQEDFYQQMLEVRQQVESGTSPKALTDKITAIRQGLEQVLSQIHQRLERLE